MPTAAEIMAANGMQNAESIVRAADMEGVPYAIAATLIYGESGGKHIWGHDGVQTGGTYQKGGAVTRQNYEAYRAAMKAGRIGRQGCGPAQCTSAQYQDTADQLGGCWDIVANIRSGLRGMKALMDRYGTRDGARRYNGSGPMAERYADKFMERLGIWQGRMKGAASGGKPSATTPAPAASGGAAAFRAEHGQVGAHIFRLAGFLNGHFPAYSSIPLEPSPDQQRYGDQTAAVIREFAKRSGIAGADGRTVGPQIAGALAKLGFRG